MNKEEYIRKWLNDELSKEERVEFERSSEFQSLKRLSGALNRFKAPDYDINEGLQDLNARKAPDGKVVKIDWFKQVLRVAAVILLAVASYLVFIRQSSTSIRTLASENQVIYLPDSSKVSLNANSFISYKAKKWHKSREVILKGEAYFEVSKGSDFNVITDAGWVQVLGTQFNVKDRSGYYEVICYEGKVGVKLGSNSFELAPKQSVRALNGIIQDTNFLITEEQPSWMQAVSSFNSIPYKYVIDEFENQFGVKVSFEGIDGEKLFTGKFDNRNKQLALEAITKPLNLKFEEIEGGDIILSGEEN